MAGWGYILYQIFAGEAGSIAADDRRVGEHVRESFATMRWMVGRHGKISMNVGALVHHFYMREYWVQFTPLPSFIATLIERALSLGKWSSAS